MKLLSWNFQLWLGFPRLLMLCFWVRNGCWLWLHLKMLILLFFHCLSDSDLHMAALALELCCTLMADRKSSPNVGLAVRNKVLPQALTLINSPLLQGQALLVTLSSNTKHYLWSRSMLGFKFFLLDIAGFTKLFCCFSLLCKYKFWHFTGLASFTC